MSSKKTNEEIQAYLVAMLGDEGVPRPGQYYSHYESPDLYRVLDLQVDPDDGCKLRIAYINVYTGIQWSRSYEKWKEPVVKDGVEVRRYTQVDPPKFKTLAEEMRETLQKAVRT